MGLIKRLLGIFKPLLNERTSSKDSHTVSTPRRGRSKRDSSRTRVLDLSNVTYIPLPPSPPSWEMRQEKESGTVHWSRYHYDVLQAYSENKYNKVVSFIENIPVNSRVGEEGLALVRSYRKIVKKWMYKNKPAIALKWSNEMINSLSDLITDTDRKLHNKLISEIESVGIKHEYLKQDIDKSEKIKEPLFIVPDWCNWSIESMESIPMSGRPNPALRDIFPIIDGSIAFDTRPININNLDRKAVVQVRDITGNVTHDSILTHDIYRISVNPLGTCFSVLSSSCTFYVYNTDLDIIFTMDLINNRKLKDYTGSSGYLNQISSSIFGINKSKNYIRCVGSSTQMDRFLYTIVDQIWCVSEYGKEIWSLLMPPKPGWEKFSRRVQRFCTSQEVIDALNYIGLSLPFSIEDIKRRYHVLAKQWHPDLHVDKVKAHERMIKLNDSIEVITGADPRSLVLFEEEVVSYKKVLDSYNIESTGIGTIKVEFSLYGPGEDWIYAASFSGIGNNVYIGTYSGRVIKLDSDGRALQVFDIGSVPDQILCTGSHLYILTNTRLYIIRENELIQILDIYDKGKIIYTRKGFGLIASKCFKWYSKNGKLEGEILSKNPIRLIYSSPNGIVIETRQHRASIAGAEVW